MSELIWHDERPLDRPVLIVAFSGLFDAGDVATRAVTWLVEHLDARPMASIDPEAFCNFHQARPMVSLDNEGNRRIDWPDYTVHATDRGGSERDLLLLSGIEPHFRWRTFTGLIREVAARAGVEMIVTVGAQPAQAPHTRPPVVFSSSTNSALVSRLGLSRPKYQGPTGVLGVLQAGLDHDGPPSVAMRVEVPHYAVGESDPKATMALLQHLEHVTGVATSHAGLIGEANAWQAKVDAAVAGDPQAAAYVRQLEAHYDSRAEQQVHSGEDLAAEFERFLREQRGDG